MKILTIILVLYIASMASAQDRFWTKETKAEVAILTGETLVDGIYTRRALMAGARELNPLTRMLVTHGTPVVVACEIGAVGTIGISYLFYRLHHPRISRTILRVAVIVEGGNMVREVRLK